MNEEVMKLFGVDLEILKRLVGIAMSTGGVYADLFFEYSTSNDITLRDNTVNAIGSNVDYGVGIRVLNGEHTGYAYSESTQWRDMERAARAAAAIASGISGRMPPVAVQVLSVGDFYHEESLWSDCGIESKKLYLRLLDEKIFQLDERVRRVIARLSDSDTKVMFYNSEGEFFCDSRPLACVSASCVLSDGSITESAAVSRSFRMGAEMLSVQLMDDMVAEFAARIPLLFEARQPKGGRMPVIMGAGGSGILLHEAIGHAFEADFIRKGTSIFSDRIGQKICSDKISVVDDATIFANRGAVNIDDEGVPGQKTYMVRDGVLTSFLHDRISASHFGVAPTGNGRRESFRFNPIPRMRATYMEGGDCTEEEIIRSVKNGIYVDIFRNGQVQIGAGDFTFYVKSGFLVENGRLTAPIKDVNIIGNGPQALADIVAVADNSRIDNGSWTCGKDQYCYVSCGMPTVLVKSLTVGGEV